MFGHVVGEIDESVGVSPLVIVPGDDLNEFWRKLDTGFGVEDGGEWAGNEVLRDDLLVGVTENALEFTLGSSLHLLADLIVGGVLLQSNGEINDGDVGGWDSEGHTSEFSIELWDNLTNSLGGTSGGWDNVGTSSSTGSPVFTSLGWSIDGELVHGDGVDSGHETLLNAEVVVENLGDWSEAVGGAGSVGNNGHVRGVSGVVDTNDEDWDVVLWWSGKNDFLGTSLDVQITLLLSEENTGGLANVIGTNGSPSDLGWVSLVEDLDEVSIDLDTTVALLNSSWESSVDGIVLEEIAEVIEAHERIVDGHALGFIFVAKESGSENKSTDSSESVDSHSNSAHDVLVCFLKNKLYKSSLIGPFKPNF